MRQKNDKKVKSNAFKRDLNVDRPKTRAYVKQETEDSKEALNRALYFPVKTESPSLEISQYESSIPTKILRSSSKGIKNRRCSICNITFSRRDHYPDYELHSHKTKETPVIDLKPLCCNICDRSFTIRSLYCQHMANLNNVHIPLSRPKLDPSKTPDIEDPNSYCRSCNYTFKSRHNYFSHLITVHRMSDLKPLPEEPRKPKSMKSATIDTLNLNCDACQKVYATKRTYIRHLVQFHKMNLPDIYSEPSNFDAENRYCKTCDMKYKARRKFIAHLQKYMI
ncbi:hypothetical protein EDC94DRAFT_78216 [Helicostylum pulchrum]|nr:hypothetical protein EDC94DRAFT_78216 [Helicostylum pulchrum]